MSTQKIGRYEVRAELGRGGMATVFHAYDPNFERDVAIKVLPEVFMHDPQFRVRFEREAKTIAMLEHPAIVPVYDFGESTNQPYIVMRYMSGGTLSDRMKQGAMSLIDTTRLISRLAPALDAAHARGIIHRDIKPGNILFDQYGNAFLSDFGIAHLSAEGMTTMTGGSALGTPAYMSPEQIQGDKKVDGRSDIYALGVLVYQMLTGQMPYSADTPAKMMMMHVLQPVPQILMVRTDLPFDCDAIINQAMAKNPDDRYATAGELAEALELTLNANKGIASSAPANYHSIPADAATAVVGAGAAGAPTLQASSLAPTIASAAPALPLETPKKTKSPAGLIGVIVLGVIVVAAIALFLMGRQGQGPLAMLAPATPTVEPTATPELPTPTTSLPTATVAVVSAATETPTEQPIETATLAATATLTPTVQAAVPLLGGADKIAYLDGKNIYMANLDGTQRIQLTTDGADKWNLQWAPDGNSVFYITGKCVQAVDIETTGIDNINCFNFTDSLKSFQISPDAKNVAISLDNQLYLVPFDLEKLRQVKRRSDLTEMAECKDFAPYEQFFAEGAQWSKDGQFIAMLLIANLGNNKRGNVIQLTAIDQCVPNPQKINSFPGSTFTMEGYDENPDIQNFGFDGYSLFTVNNTIRNDGFGDLYGFNSELSKPTLKMNPVNKSCCYRDSQFSPDGSYLVFAYQDFLQGSNSTTQIYLIPYGSIGTGAQYTPIALPDILDPKEKPQPVLRPAQSP